MGEEEGSNMNTEQALWVTDLLFAVSSNVIFPFCKYMGKYCIKYCGNFLW